MTAVAGPVWIAAVLLVLSGIGKVLRPAPTRQALRDAGLPARGPVAPLVGVVELTVAGWLLVLGGPLAAGALGAVYLGFTLFLLRLRARAGASASCSCLGTRRTPVTLAHVGLNLVVVVLAGLAVAAPLEPAATMLAATPWTGAPALALVGLGVVLTRGLYAELPPVLEAAGMLAGDPKDDR